MYGARFYETFGPKPNESWVSALKELRYDQVRAALTKVRNSGSPHPPSLPEFVALARNVRALQPVEKPEVQLDNFATFANRRMFAYLANRGAANPQSLQQLIETKNRLAADFRAMNDEQQVDETQFQDALYRAWDRVWVAA